MLYIKGQTSICETFVVPSNVFALRVNDEGDICAMGAGDFDEVIATYRNKEEALKVIDVILKKLSNAIPNMAYVIELPEESEVNEWLERN